MGFSPSRARSVVGSVTQTIELECESSAQVDDLVRQDASNDNAVIVATDNSDIKPVIGRIKEKLSDTLCVVILRGVVDVTGISRGRAYLSQTGKFTVTPPSNSGGVLQILGYSFGNGKLHFEPNTITTRLQ